MICFDIQKNGKRLCLAGIDGHCVLSAHVTFVDVVDPGPRPRRTLEVAAAGMESETKVHLNWVRSDIAVGDRIEIRVIDAESADPPTHRSGPVRPKELIKDNLGRIRARRKALLSELKDLDRNEAACVKEAASEAMKGGATLSRRHGRTRRSRRRPKAGPA